MKKAAFSFNESDQLTSEQIGSKASNLLRLRKHGFQVPDGFCVTCDACQKHTLQFSTHINDSELDLEKIRNLILEATIDPAIVADIKACFQSLLNAEVAVRSSATAEDLPGHSFAGQYETYLNIESFSDCLEAVKKCWASLWTERAYSYREKNGINHFDVKMAVIVQEMVHADIAGVMFTADPLRGSTDRIVIEACRGLGEALVSGRVTPDEMIFAKKNTKPIWILPADMNELACLSIRMGRRLAKAGKKIEQIYGNPQDIEWAIANKKIYFLQTRPVTVKLKQKTWEEHQVWSNMNTGEVLPDVVTPISWSIFSRMFKPLFRSVWRMFGTDLKDNVVAGLVLGRVYFNLNTSVAAIQHFPKFVQKKLNAEALLGGKLSEEIGAGRLKFYKEDLPDVKGSLWKLIRRIPEDLYQLYRHRPSQGQKFLERIHLLNDQLKAMDLTKMSDCELAELFQATIDKAMKDWDLLFIVTAFASYPALRFLCRKWLGDKNGNLVHQLIRGQQGIEDVQAGFDLWNLAVTANQSESVRTRVLSGEQWQHVRESLEDIESGRAFLKDWDVFMDVHGHHCRGEVELYNSRWFENPDYIFQIVKNYLSGMGKIDPIQKYKQLEVQQKQIIKQCQEKLRNPIRRFLFGYFIRRIHFGLKLRENWKSQAVRLVVHLRRILIELGARLFEQEIFEKPDDVFFLTMEEIQSVFDHDLVANLRKIIKERRDEYENNKKVEPPHLVIGIYNPEDEMPKETATNVRTLNGMSACPGTAIGKARVILRADDKEQVLPGEILVAPFTDPAWTPYFLPASAIVMDQGGLLSHGSIVAREYGIPAVVNVGPATKIIQTGQTIEVDANQGVVKILS